MLTVITPHLLFNSQINSKSFSIFNLLNHSCFSFQGPDVVGELGVLCTAAETLAPGTEGCSSTAHTQQSGPRTALGNDQCVRWGGHKPRAPQLPERGWGSSAPNHAILELLFCQAPRKNQPRGRRARLGNRSASQVIEWSTGPASTVLSAPMPDPHPLPFEGVGSGLHPQGSSNQPHHQHQDLRLWIIHWEGSHALPGCGGQKIPGAGLIPAQRS